VPQEPIFQQPQRNRNFQQHEPRNFPTHNFRHQDNNLRHENRSRQRSYHREDDDEDDFVHQKPVFTGRRDFADADNKNNNTEEYDDDNFVHEKRPFTGRRDFNQDDDATVGHQDSFENVDRRRFGKDFPGQQQQRRQPQQQQRYKREEEGSRFLGSDRERQKSPARHEQQVT